MKLSQAAISFYSAATYGNVPKAARFAPSVASHEMRPFVIGLGGYDRPHAAELHAVLYEAHKEGRDTFEIVSDVSPKDMRETISLLLHEDPRTAQLFQEVEAVTAAVRTVIQNALWSLDRLQGEVDAEVKAVTDRYNTAEAVKILLEKLNASTEPIRSAQLKASIVPRLWEASRTEIMQGLKDALSVSDPASQLAADAVVFAFWFGNTILPEVQAVWPSQDRTTAKDRALRESLALICRKLGPAALIPLKKLRHYDTFGQERIVQTMERISGENDRPYRSIFADFDDETIVVYQAFNQQLAERALIQQTLQVPGFKKGRTTWVKPSFQWMLYRSRYGSVDEGQHGILGIRIRRTVFDALLAGAVLTHFQPVLHPTREEWKRAKEGAKVLVQWDPERTVDLAPLPHRAIQIGLKGIAIQSYLDGIVAIDDLTATAHIIQNMVKRGRMGETGVFLPVEREYTVSNATQTRLGIEST